MDKTAFIDCEIKQEIEMNLTTEFDSELKEHDIFKYFCTLCQFQTKNMGNLTKHKQYTHEGVRYPCNQCGYQATTQSALKRHINHKHEGVLYVCNLCEYETGRQDSLFQAQTVSS